MKTNNWFLNLWWSIRYFNTNTTKEKHNGLTVSCHGSAEKARGRK